jgi:hypothetical protein
LAFALSAPVDCDPLTALAPDQEPAALQAVALVEDQVRVELLPETTVLGFALIFTVGADITAAPVTVTLADRVAEPSGPVQVSPNTVVSVRGPVDRRPEVETLPCQPSEASQAVAPVVFQKRLVVPPLLTVVGLTLNVIDGAPGEAAASAVLLALAPSELRAANASIDLNANGNLERWL